MKKLIVSNPVNLQGNSFALAFRGTEIAGELKPGVEVQLVDTNGQELLNVEVLDVWGGPTGNFPALLAEMMQDPLCRTFTGLFTHLALSRTKESETTDMNTPLSVVIVKPKVSSIIRATSSQIAKMK
tara:strand:- start:17544 stop:17924 length:381 start_codon:yes stop_codon:yes gene_type:complete